MKLFVLALLMISITNIIPSCLCENDDIQHTNCNDAFICESSNITNLKYPFWGGNRGKYCGVNDDPNMELTCEDSVPKLTINDYYYLKYSILEWDNSTQKLRVIRDDCSSGDICVPVNNFTFNSTLFKLYDDVANVAVFYSCLFTTETPPNTFHSVECISHNSSVLYTVVDPDTATYSDYYCRMLMIPISKTRAAQLGSGNGTISDAIKDGFDLKWTGDYGECQRCVVSGGACGNDGGSEFRCFCKDGPHTTSCNSENPPASENSNPPASENSPASSM
jgi:hypothetical protein